MAVRKPRKLSAYYAAADLPATGPERIGWRVNVETDNGIDAYGVLVAPSHDTWRSRILTFPNILWVGPQRGVTLKFEGTTPQDAEQKAIGFIREHCRKRNFLMRDEICVAVPGQYDQPREPQIEVIDLGDMDDQELAERKIRFLPVRFGIQHPSENAGTGNLSESGIFIITDTPAQKGDLLNLLIRLENKEITMRGKVRWMRDARLIGRSPGMGVQLLDPPVDYLNYVRALL